MSNSESARWWVLSTARLPKVVEVGERRAGGLWAAAAVAAASSSTTGLLSCRDRGLARLCASGPGLLLGRWVVWAGLERRAPLPGMRPGRLDCR